jgi:hypothetical protein
MSRFVGGPFTHPDKANNIPANTRSSMTISSFFMKSLQKEKALPDLVDEENKGPTLRRFCRHMFNPSAWVFQGKKVLPADGQASCPCAA